MSGGDRQEVRFRPATADDWPEIWLVVHAVVSSGDTYMHPPDLREREARAAWMPGGERAITYVGLIGDRIVATALLKPNHAGPGDHVANTAWMVSPDASGSGIGRRFGGYVLAEAQRLEFRGMQFNAVVSTNERAVRLWESLGFEIVGTVPNAFRHPDVGDVAVHVMYRPLSS